MKGIRFAVLTLATALVFGFGTLDAVPAAADVTATIQVKDANNNAAPSARVTVYRIGDGAFFGSGQADSTGKFRLTLASNWTLLVFARVGTPGSAYWGSAPGLADSTIVVKTTTSESTSIRHVDYCRTSVAYVDSHGQPITSAPVKYLALESNTIGQAVFAQTRTDSTGATSATVWLGVDGDTPGPAYQFMFLVWKRGYSPGFLIVAPMQDGCSPPPGTVYVPGGG